MARNSLVTFHKKSQETAFIGQPSQSPRIIWSDDFKPYPTKILGDWLCELNWCGTAIGSFILTSGSSMRVSVRDALFETVQSSSTKEDPGGCYKRAPPFRDRNRWDGQEDTEGLKPFRGKWIRSPVTLGAYTQDPPAYKTSKELHKFSWCCGQKWQSSAPILDPRQVALSLSKTKTSSQRSGSWLAVNEAIYQSRPWQIVIRTDRPAQEGSLLQTGKAPLCHQPRFPLYHTWRPALCYQLEPSGRKEPCRLSPMISSNRGLHAFKGGTPWRNCTTWSQDETGLHLQLLNLSRKQPRVLRPQL